MTDHLATHKPLTAEELINLYQAVDEISLAAITEPDVYRLFVTIFDRDREIGQLRTIVDGMGEQMRAVVAHHVQELTIKQLNQEVFALKDGLRGWKSIAEEAQKRGDECEKFKQIVTEVSAVVDERDPTIEGSLAERVREAIKRRT